MVFSFFEKFAFVAIRVPRPKAPLPKGGWHGEAVPGGYIGFTRIASIISLYPLG